MVSPWFNLYFLPRARYFQWNFSSALQKCHVQLFSRQNLGTAAGNLASTWGQISVWWHSNKQGRPLYFRLDIFTLDWLSSSSDWARLKWLAKIAFFLASLLRSPNILLQLFEVYNITDVGSLLGLQQLLCWFPGCVIRSFKSILFYFIFLRSSQGTFWYVCLVNKHWNLY